MLTHFKNEIWLNVCLNSRPKANIPILKCGKPSSYHEYHEVRYITQSLYYAFQALITAITTNRLKRWADIANYRALVNHPGVKTIV